MKKCISLFIVVACLLIGHTAAIAQDDETTNAPVAPRWVSEKGYWVVESNIKVPKQYVVRFYNNDHVMVYKEQVQGIVLRLNKRKVKMNLKRVLDASIVAWEKQHESKENEGWVVNAIQ